MHEMAIASSVLEGALRHAGGRRITHVQLKIGDLRQVVIGSLEFGWEIVTKGTPAAGAVLGVERIEAAGVCRGCDAETPQSRFPFRCGACGGYDLTVVRGDELLIDWLEVEDPGDPEPSVPERHEASCT